MKLLLATHNNNKKKEILDIFKDNGIKDIEIVTLEDLGDYEDIEETGLTFRENAFLKASYGYSKYHLPTIGEDSGLEIDYLGGKPGIYSARYSGLGSEANIDKVLEELKGVKKEERSCNFVCTICFFCDDLSHFFEGLCYGYIGFERQGNNGFGYDPIFMIDDKTSLAMLPEEKKNKISHRYNAFSKLIDYLKDYPK